MFKGRNFKGCTMGIGVDMSRRVLLIFALVRMLTIWTQDESQIDSIFRSSGLYREKWDKNGGYYGKRTIRRALDMAQSSRNVAEM